MEDEVRITALQKTGSFLFSLMDLIMNHMVSHIMKVFMKYFFLSVRVAKKKKILTNMNVMKMKLIVPFYLFCIWL